jgi:hypothetical protein
MTGCTVYQGGIIAQFYKENGSRHSHFKIFHVLGYFDARCICWNRGVLSSVEFVANSDEKRN